MSVELLFKNKDTGESNLIPISSNEIFENYWIPECRRLSLNLIPMLLDGIDITRDTIPYFMTEFSRLRESILSKERPEKNDNLIIDRINVIIDFLEMINSNPNLRFELF